MSSSGSVSSLSSLSSTSSEHIDLSDRARKIITAICNNTKSASDIPFVSQDAVIQRDDDLYTTSLPAFLESRRCNFMSADIYMQIREAVVDEEQRKVWVRSEIFGPSGLLKQNIDMLYFDDAGILIRDDCSRVRRSRSQ